MGVDVKDLPPAYQAQALRKWAEQERRKKRPPLPCPADAGPGKPTKYHNKPTERVTASGAVLRFDSQKEARRYDELSAADFTYVRVKETIGEYTFRDQLVVEDVKSRATRTKEYIMKRKLMKERFNIDIQEV